MHTDLHTCKLKNFYLLRVCLTLFIKLIQPIPFKLSFLKVLSTKLEHLFCHVSTKRDVRALSFKLWNSFWTAFENATSNGIGCTGTDLFSQHFLKNAPTSKCALRAPTSRRLFHFLGRCNLAIIMILLRGGRMLYFLHMRPKATIQGVQAIIE